ncbi:hypothetical protein [Modestobacter roseus]|uniref:Uncharacterized protein n=1 Tax=Modestobacter roseus TaxID=1181884 RepID=A0A562IWF6_9ACTN|nr:hypothetical protein [Modestobacter roseus]MQA34028.1 hypothetical protein [Modestobacter roseus]TWH75391.1 hypothetical protein JD78_03947 [Modestobacter roseus]
MILAVIGVTWLTVSVLVGCVLGRTISVADHALDRDDAAPTLGGQPLYVSDILAAERPSTTTS